VHEQTLREYFEGRIGADNLAVDVRGSTEITGIVYVQRIVDMEDEFRVHRPHLLKLCDAVIAGEFPSDLLAEIGFALMASDKFVWDSDDDELVAAVIADWASPEVNFPLTLENIKRFRGWLLHEESYPRKPELKATESERVISFRKKNG
jgi:hypothetical protein